jgi:hypothetical protein
LAPATVERLHVGSGGTRGIERVSLASGWYHE